MRAEEAMLEEEKAKNKVTKVGEKVEAAEPEQQKTVPAEKVPEKVETEAEVPTFKIEMPTEEEKKQEAEVFAREAICVSRQPHKRPRPLPQDSLKEEEDETAKSGAESAEPGQPEESQAEDHSRAEGPGEHSEPVEERPRPESADKVVVPVFDDGEDDDDEDFADDEDWQSFQQNQKQVG